MRFLAGLLIGSLPWVMAYRSRVTFETPEATRQELERVDNFKQDSIPFKDRTPHSADKGSFWIHINGANLDLYIRHPETGAWKGPSTFS